MALELKLDHPGYPKGYELEIAGVGAVKNGGTLTLTEDQERAYIIRNGQTLKESITGDGAWKVTGTPIIKSVKDGLDGDEPLAPDEPIAVMIPETDDSIDNNDDN